jgi:hypothetical protein
VVDGSCASARCLPPSLGFTTVLFLGIDLTPTQGRSYLWGAAAVRGALYFGAEQGLVVQLMPAPTST